MTVKDIIDGRGPGLPMIASLRRRQRRYERLNTHQQELDWTGQQEIDWTGMTPSAVGTMQADLD